MKPFNLVRAQAGDPIVTRDGREMSTLKWIKVQKYCELSGDTLEGVRAKRRKRIWTEGVHWSRPADGVFYINIEEVSKWVENQSPSERLAA